MRTVRTMFAVMLLGLTLTAFETDALAQARRSASSRSVSTTTSKPAVSKKSDSKPRTAVTRQSSVRKQTGTNTATRQQTVRRTPSTTKQVTKPAAEKQSKNTKAIRQSVRRPAKDAAAKQPTVRPSSEPVKVTRPARQPDRRPGNEANRPDIRPDKRPDQPQHMHHDHRPSYRHDHPRDRDFMHYSAPGHYWSHHNHCYGYRVRVLPAHVHHYVHYGVSYYCYDDIWYRPHGDYYVVCRPPFGTILAAELIADMAWAAVRLSYYNTVVNTYSQINENNAYIAQQNEIIAQNNAVIAAQNSTLAINQAQAQAAYTLANQLGLIQSYAAAGSDYYYQDGVFYAKNASGEYRVIVPPAGALVETIPEDYDMVVLSDGKEYYKVDYTVYKVTIADGKPYFEVLGQLYR